MLRMVRGRKRQKLPEPPQTSPEKQHCFVCHEEDETIVSQCACKCLVAHEECVRKIKIRGSGSKCKICDTVYKCLECEHGEEETALAPLMHDLGAAAAGLFYHHFRSTNVEFADLSCEGIIQSLYVFHEVDQHGIEDLKREFARIDKPCDEPISLMLAIGALPPLQPMPNEADKKVFLDSFNQRYTALCSAHHA